MDVTENAQAGTNNACITKAVESRATTITNSTMDQVENVIANEVVNIENIETVECADIFASTTAPKNDCATDVPTKTFQNLHE